MRVGSLAGRRVVGRFSAKPRVLGLVAGGLAIVVVALGLRAWAWSTAPAPLALEPAAPAVEVRPVAPFRDYPAVLPEDVWPERPPFAVVRGFPPAPPAPPRFSAGPVRRFGLPRFDVDSAIEVLSVTPANELPVPTDANYRVGWYTDFGQPGQGGNAVFSAHETWNHYQAPFFNLSKAEPGDPVVIDMADGRRLAYAVISNTRYDVNAMPMETILWPPLRGSDEWITLITCGGRIVYDERTGYGEYLDRDVVVARRVG